MPLDPLTAFPLLRWMVQPDSTQSLCNRAKTEETKPVSKFQAIQNLKIELRCTSPPSLTLANGCGWLARAGSLKRNKVGVGPTRQISVLDSSGRLKWHLIGFCRVEGAAASWSQCRFLRNVPRKGPQGPFQLVFHPAPGDCSQILHPSFI